MSDDVSTPGAPTFRTLTCLGNAPAGDAAIAQIEADLAATRSSLSMMKGYMDDLKGTPDNDALPFRKLHRLFQLGLTPNALEGHHHGVAIGLRTGDLEGISAEHASLLGLVWGAAAAGVCPWVGKSFVAMNPDHREQVAGDAIPAGMAAFRGINHFHVLERARLGVAANAVLTFLWQVKEAPIADRKTYGHRRNGGHFAAWRAFSVCDRTPREVFRLDYRFPALRNSRPLAYVIDEVVEIGDGLYLGQRLIATSRLLERYDPKSDFRTYRYRNFGYFILFGKEWTEEARRLFPHLGIPGASRSPAVASPRAARATPSAALRDEFRT